MYLIRVGALVYSKEYNDIEEARNDAEKWRLTLDKYASKFRYNKVEILQIEVVETRD